MRMLTTYLRELHTVALPAAVQPAIDLLALTLRTPADPAEALRDYLGANFAESELTVAELARRHHLSPRRVHEIFAATGATPAAYLRTLRLLAARDALADPHRSGQTVARIAKAAGFPELRSFERAFHREYGMSPGTFRRLLR
jgi:AraC-like DNA-binding protein